MSKRLRVVSLLGLVAACSDPGFETFEEVSRLRTLAIAMEPPELGPGEVAQIASLTVEPGGAPIAYRWELCLFTEGPDAYYACAQDEELGVAGVPLGTTERVELPYEAVASAVNLRAICDAIAGLDLPAFVELPDCADGLELTVRLTATAEGEEHVSVFPITLLFADTAATAARNRTPALQGMLAGESLLDAGAPNAVDVPADGELPLQLLLNADEAESFEEPADDGELVTDREQLSVRWFSTHGRFERGQTFFAEGIAPATELQFNTLDLQEGRIPEPGDEVTIWVVIRDTRGGVTWREWVIQPPEI